MRRRSALLILLSLTYVSCILAPLWAERSSAVVDGFNHAVFDENFTSATQSACRIDGSSLLANYSAYTTIEDSETVHSLHVVSFHSHDPLNNTKSEERFSYYGLDPTTDVPSHVYDGGFIRARGYINQSDMNASGARSLQHAILDMRLSKSIDSSTLSFSGTVTNLQEFAFHGFILVFVTENQKVVPPMIWNFVFMDYGLNKTVNLASLSTDTFSSTWTIPVGTNANNIQVFAVAYDTDIRDAQYGWPTAVQSVCDVCGHSVAVLEFPGVFLFLAAFTAVSAIVVVIFRRREPCRQTQRNSGCQAA